MVSVALVCAFLDILGLQASIYHNEVTQPLIEVSGVKCPVQRNMVELQGWQAVLSDGCQSIRLGRAVDSTSCLLKCQSSVPLESSVPQEQPRCRLVSFDMDQGLCEGFTSRSVLALRRNISHTLVGNSGKKFDRKERFRLQDRDYLLSKEGLQMYAAESCLALCHILPQCNVCTFNEYQGTCWLKSLQRPIQLIDVETANRGVVSFVS
jgi:hypothetical protein